MAHREFSFAHLSPLGQKGAEPGPQETTGHHAKKQETEGRAYRKDRMLHLISGCQINQLQCRHA